MVFFIIYIFLYSDFASFWSRVLGFGSGLSVHSANITLALGSAYLLVLFLKGKIRANPLTFLILGYIVLRVVIQVSFALYHDYSVIAYLLPIKNWLALLFFFIIGQSVDFSLSKLHRVLFTCFVLFALCAAAYEIVALFIESNPGFYQSRLPFFQYRIPLDIFLTCYICMVATMEFLSQRMVSKRYLLIMTMIVLAIVVSQIQQMLVGVVLIPIILFSAFWLRHRLPGRYAIYFSAFALLMVVAGFSLYHFYASAGQDVYFSIYRRNLLLEYVTDKVMAYPIAGYPIPSPSFSENIPDDIVMNFFEFDFEKIIFPSDIPLLSAVAEEGVLGLLYIIFFLWLCYRRNPYTKYFIFVILVTITNFRMYYLTTLIASFSYFMLGYFTSSARRVGEVKDPLRVEKPGAQSGADAKNGSIGRATCRL